MKKYYSSRAKKFDSLCLFSFTILVFAKLGFEIKVQVRLYLFLDDLLLAE